MKNIDEKNNALKLILESSKEEIKQITSSKDKARDNFSVAYRNYYDDFNQKKNTVQEKINTIEKEIEDLEKKKNVLNKKYALVVTAGDSDQVKVVENELSLMETERSNLISRKEVLSVHKISGDDKLYKTLEDAFRDEIKAKELNCENMSTLEKFLNEVMDEATKLKKSLNFINIDYIDDDLMIKAYEKQNGVIDTNGSYMAVDIIKRRAIRKVISKN